jgi:hypothetical protein
LVTVAFDVIVVYADSKTEIADVSVVVGVETAAKLGIGVVFVYAADFEAMANFGVMI